VAAQKVGLIGLGAIGLPLAVNLIGKGFEVRGYRRGAMDGFRAIGGIPAASPKDVARECDVVLTVLPSYADIEQVLSGPDGVLAAKRANLVLVELSTLALGDKERLRAAVEATGGKMLDSPLSGVPRMVQQRAAVIFASGDQAAYERCKPVFDGMSDKAFYLGAFGVGSKMKFVANALVAIHILAAAEAMALGAKAGLDPELMVKLLSPSAGTSLQFQVRAPMMAQRKYDPVLAPNSVMGKDLPTIVAFAEELGCPAPLTHTAWDYFRRAQSGEMRDTDVASIYDIVARECGLLA
jgi:3-hydroxyisobutyrate dehydrogenase